MDIFIFFVLAIVHSLKGGADWNSATVPKSLLTPLQNEVQIKWPHSKHETIFAVIDFIWFPFPLMI